MSSWRVWLMGLTCSLVWVSAIVTYLIQWEIGWFFGVILAAAMFLVWVVEYDLRQLHRLQLIQLEKALADERAANQAHEERLQDYKEVILFHTNHFLDEQNHHCTGCGAKNIWLYTRYKFHPAAHVSGCQVVQLRDKFIEPAPLWLPREFQAKYLEPKWQNSPVLRDNPAYSDFFAAQPPEPDSNGDWHF